MKFFKEKLDSRESRILKFGELYRESRKQYYEDTIPNSLYNFLEESLMSIPGKDIFLMSDKQLTSMFKNVIRNIKETHESVK